VQSSGAASAFLTRTLKMKAEDSSERLSPVYNATLHHIPHFVFVNLRSSVLVSVEAMRLLFRMWEVKALNSGPRPVGLSWPRPLPFPFVQDHRALSFNHLNTLTVRGTVCV
jgi:hypothetical protein